MGYIPMGLIADIFSWLPVKSLLRFRCVSKPWRDLIDDPHFIKSHIDRSIKSKNNLRVFIIRYDNNYSLPFDSLDDAIVELDWPFKYSVDKTKFWGYCDGLVCLGIGKENAAIWNPATRKCRKLPVAPIEFPENCQDEPIISFAIGCDSITDDYKVVRMVEFGFFKYDVEVRVYSMRLNFWRRVQDIPCEFGVWQWPMGGLSAVGCGVLHWIGLAPFGNLIVAFDLLAEEHRLLPGPECDDTWNLGELGGSLCIFVYNKVGVRIDVWVMKDYGVKESWSRMFSVPYDLLPVERVVPVAYSKSGGKVLVLRNNEKFLWYDIEQQVREDIDTLGLPEYFGAKMCMESLVPVNGGETD